MAKVIFLDVDGVLCTARSHLALGYPRGDRIWNAWDELACACLREVCERGIQIVVSSTWRHPRHEPELMQKMTLHRLIGYLRQPNWKTPDFSDQEFIRGHEIAKYLTDNPDIDDYKIVDDVPQFLDEQGKHFIHTDAEDGMTHENMQKLFRWVRILRS